MNAPVSLGSPRLTRDEKRRFLRKNNALALTIFAGALGGYAATLVTTLAVGSPPIALPMSMWCGLAIGLLFIIGHDACHQAFTGSHVANHVIGRLAFLPSLHPFSLWDLGHNRTHHRYNNIRGLDYVWEPMTPAEYRHAPAGKQRMYRFYRSPLGVFCYYGVEIWAKRMFFVRPRSLPDQRRAYRWDLISAWAVVPVQASLVIWLGSLFGKGPTYSLLFGMLVPFLTWNGLMSFVIYLHHIHPAVRWYDSVESWRASNGAIAGTVHVQLPWLIDKLLLHIMQHNAHHHLPGVPLYNLAPLQRMVERRDSVSWRWSAREFLSVSRNCKLFDYETDQWRGFDALQEFAQT